MSPPRLQKPSAMRIRLHAAAAATKIQTRQTDTNSPAAVKQSRAQIASEEFTELHERIDSMDEQVRAPPSYAAISPHPYVI